MNMSDIVRENITMVYRLAAALTKSERACRVVCEDAFLKLARMKKIPESDEQIRDELIRKTVAASRNIFAAPMIKRKSDTEVFSRLEDMNGSAAYYGMHMLPKNNRIVLHLKSQEGMSDAEISRALKISTATVQYRRETGAEMLGQIIKSDAVEADYIKANEAIAPDDMFTELIATDASNKVIPPSVRKSVIALLAVLIAAAAITAVAVIASGRGDNDNIEITPSEATEEPSAAPDWTVDDSGERADSEITAEPVITEAPTDVPTIVPTAAPTVKPTQKPTARPTERPTSPPPTPLPTEEVTRVIEIIDEGQSMPVGVDDEDGISISEGIPEEFARDFPKLSGFIYNKLIENDGEVTCQYKGDAQKSVSITKSEPIEAVENSAETSEIGSASVLFEDASTPEEQIFTAKFNMYDSGYTLTSEGCGKDEFLEVLNELLQKLQD